MKQDHESQHYFGHKAVSADEKKYKVQEVFTSVANKYDLMNDLMSLGLHRCWKDEFVRLLPIKNHHSILDVAGGTGDIALRLLKRQPKEVMVLDRNASMLVSGKHKAIDQGVLELNWVCGDAECLPFSDASFDFYTISFGIRNVTHRELALKEAWRVLKPGGVFACLEFSKITSNFFRPLVKLYHSHFIPLLGDIVTGDRESYQYLIESIERFPSREDFSQEIEEAGFSMAAIHPFIQGGVAAHIALKRPLPKDSF